MDQLFSPSDPVEKPREYAVVAIDTSLHGQTFSVMRFLSSEEAMEMARDDVPHNSERARLSTALNVVRHYNSETTPRPVIKSNSMGSGMSPHESEYEIFTPELSAVQVSTYELACATISQYFVQGLDPKVVRLARDMTEK